MPIKPLITLAMALLLCAVPAWSQTARWLAGPAYDSMEPLSESLVRVSDGKAYGLVSTDGKVIAPCSYSLVTDPSGGRCLLLSGERLSGMVSMEGTVRLFSDPLFVDPAYPFFSEGLLAVHDVNGAWTYMDTDGNFPIHRLFRQAAPFLHGLAAVQERGGDGSFMHMDRNGRYSLLGSEFSDNFLLFASSFSEVDGVLLAVVVDGHNEAWIRNMRGNKVSALGKVKAYDKAAGILTTSDYRIRLSPDKRIVSRETLSDKSVKHFLLADSPSYTPPTGQLRLTAGPDARGVGIGLEGGEELLVPQFREARIIGTKQVLAQTDKGWGLLEITSQAAPVCRLSQEQISYSHTGEMTVPCQLSLQDDVALSSVHVTVWLGGECCFDAAAPERSFSVSCPVHPESGSVAFRSQTSVDGLVYPPVSQEARLVHTNAFSVKAPAMVTLNESNTGAIFNLTVVNGSTSESAPCDIVVDGKLLRRGVVFPPGGSISFTVNRSIDLEDLDEVWSNVRLQVTEPGCPPFDTHVRIQFLRYFN